MFLGNLIAQREDLIDAGGGGGSGGSAFNDTFGAIEAPQGVEEYNTLAGDGGIGILVFLSRFIQLIFVLAGIWVMFNFIIAGFIYMSAEGDAAATGKVKNKITMSVIGLVIIVSSYAIASVLGLIFFGDPNFILNPTISGPITP
jgi:hypothetical protein